MDFTAKQTITKFGLEKALFDLGLKEEDGYSFVGHYYKDLGENGIHELTPKKFIIIEEEYFPLQDDDYSYISRVTKISTQVIDVLLEKDGYLIIVRTGERFVENFIYSYLEHDENHNTQIFNFTFVDKLDDDEENKNMEDDLDVMVRYGNMLKYYILKKNIPPTKTKIEFPERRRPGDPNYIEDLSP